MNDTKYDNPSTGCYFDEANGQTYNDIRVLELAIAYGWDVAEDDETTLIIQNGEYKLTEHQKEILSDVVDDAIEYLNEVETRDYHYWAWYSGDFGLQIDFETAKEDNPCFDTFPEVGTDDGVETNMVFCVINDHGNMDCGYYDDKKEYQSIFSIV